MSEWVSVEDRLPEPGQWVLMHGTGYAGVDRYRAGFYMPGDPPVQWNNWLSAANQLGGGDRFVTTHWMPLPEAPDE